MRRFDPIIWLVRNVPNPIPQHCLNSSLLQHSITIITRNLVSRPCIYERTLTFYSWLTAESLVASSTSSVPRSNRAGTWCRTVQIFVRCGILKLSHTIKLQHGSVGGNVVDITSIKLGNSADTIRPIITATTLRIPRTGFLSSLHSVPRILLHRGSHLNLRRTCIIL